MPLDCFRFILINARHFIACVGLRADEFVQFCVHRLSIAVFGALDDQRHAPNSQGGDGMPIEIASVKYEPAHAINVKTPKWVRLRCNCSNMVGSQQAVGGLRT